MASALNRTPICQSPIHSPSRCSTERSHLNICADGHYQQAFMAGWHRPEYAEEHTAVDRDEL